MKTLLALIAATSVAYGNPARTAFVQRADGTWERSPDGCGTVQVPGTADPIGLRAATQTRIIFLNRFGGTYHPGATDSSQNLSTLVPGSEAKILGMNTAIFDWATVSACVRTHFQGFNVRIVETEPNAPSYVEAVVGGNGTELGFGPGELFGIASADNFCGVTEKGIAFSFSETHNNVQQRNEELCATIAHEVGHLLALEHEQLPEDLLSYVLVADSPSKAFVNMDSGCGTSPQQPQNCTCSSTSTNSAGRLSTFVGTRDPETTPPALDVSSPAAGKQPPTFDVVATATDDTAMSDVVVLVDGQEIGNDFVPDGSTYTVRVKALAEGDHMLSVVASDGASNSTRKDIAITVQKAATGEDCVSNDACQGNLCAMTTDGNFCTQTCDPAASSCPSGFDCQTISGQSLCVASEGGGCCSSSSHPGAALLLGFGVVLLVFRRRR